VRTNCENLRLTIACLVIVTAIGAALTLT